LGTLAHDLHTPSKYGGHIEDQQDMVKIDTSATASSFSRMKNDHLMGVVIYKNTKKDIRRG